MDDSRSGSSATSGENLGFFDMAADDSGSAGDENRIQVLKRMLFDLAFLVMNADGTEHISEKMLIRKLEQRMEREGSVNVDSRAEELRPIMENGPDAIRDHVEELAQTVSRHAGDRTAEIGKGYLDLLKGLIVADASVSSEERELFQILCDEWNVDHSLPGA